MRVRKALSDVSLAVSHGMKARSGWVEGEEKEEERDETRMKGRRKSRIGGEVRDMVLEGRENMRKGVK